jgi:hypothetical protein
MTADETNATLIERRYRLLMTSRLILTALTGVGTISIALAQESPTASPSPTSSPTPEQTPSATPVRSVRLSFIPPPMDGTISLGIYDTNRKLVRVLHREAKIDNFTVDADSLNTTWDGKNEIGKVLPAGKYHARGYLVGHLKVEHVGQAATFPASSGAPGNAQVKLMPNPLTNDANAIVDLSVGFGEKGSYLKTLDGLPLCTVSEMPNLVRALTSKNNEKSVDVWQDDGTMVEQFRVSNIDKMMAFDCGDFELK